MDRAEAKFNHAKEVRERGRDAKFTKIKQSMHQEDLEDNWEQEQKEQEYREEQKRLAKEREQELEREIERNRQAVERAAREARERATAEAQLRAERAAVEKANAEANFSWHHSLQVSPLLYFGLNVAGPVSLTDLINAASVKKIHRKATLCLHPDKVQQKGATLQQKYITEKVFELLRYASG
ncbi:hypothetical protein BHE74_00019959, partial [Ensete ventricosum]